MARLVSLLGLSPGVAHTSLCLLAREGIVVDEIVLVGTQGEVLAEAEEIIRGCPCPWDGPPGPGRIVRVQLDFPDVRGPGDLERLGSILRGLLRRGDYLDITGGRKIMSAWAAIVALDQGAHVVASVVPPGEAERALRARDPCGKTVREAVLVRLA